jgi:hypothetical protein
MLPLTSQTERHVLLLQLVNAAAAPRASQPARPVREGEDARNGQNMHPHARSHTAHHLALKLLVLQNGFLAQLLHAVDHAAFVHLKRIPALRLMLLHGRCNRLHSAHHQYLLKQFQSGSWRLHTTTWAAGRGSTRDILLDLLPLVLYTIFESLAMRRTVTDENAPPRPAKPGAMVKKVTSKSFSGAISPALTAAGQLKRKLAGKGSPGFDVAQPLEKRALKASDYDQAKEKSLSLALCARIKEAQMLEKVGFPHDYLKVPRAATCHLACCSSVGWPRQRSPSSILGNYFS